MLLSDFFNSNEYKNDPLPSTKICATCGATLTLKLNGGNFSPFATIYEGESACYVRLKELLDYTIQNGDNLVFSIKYCDD